MLSWSIGVAHAHQLGHAATESPPCTEERRFSATHGRLEIESSLATMSQLEASG